MHSKYQQDGFGLGPLHELVVLKFKSTLSLKAPKKNLYHSCRKEVVSAEVIFINCHDICDETV